MRINTLVLLAAAFVSHSAICASANQISSNLNLCESIECQKDNKVLTRRLYKRQDPPPGDGSVTPSEVPSAAPTEVPSSNPEVASPSPSSPSEVPPTTPPSSSPPPPTSETPPPSPTSETPPPS
ncbi:hypothetical protein K7432_007016, partial [Basidiobolus ranarum]